MHIPPDMNRSLTNALLLEVYTWFLSLVIACAATSWLEADPLKAQCRGIYYLTPVEGVRHTNLRSLDAWDNPNIVGVALRVAWAEVEPSPGQFNWSYLDEAIRIAGAKKKLVAVSVIAGIHSPSWVFGSAKLLQLMGRDAKHGNAMPAPWDSNYLDAWKAFIRAMGARYDGNPVIGYVTASGPGRAEECYVVDNSMDAGQFDANRWVAAANQIIESYNAAFKTTPWVLSWGKPSLQQNQLMADLYKLPGNFGFKANSLSAFFPNTSIEEGQVALRLSKTQPIVFQALRPAKDPNALAGVLKNGERMGMQAFECYQGDARDPASQAILAAANREMGAN
jgi:Beta-galactosidase